MTGSLAHEGDALRQLEGALLDAFTVTDGVARASRSPHDMAFRIRNALRERGVRLVTVKSLAKALCRRDDTPPGLGLDDMPGEVRASYLYNAEAILALEEET